MSGNRPKILTVDDDPQIRESIAFWLQDEGYDVLQAENGRVGLELVRDEKPDVILLDLRMPVLDGFGFLERLPEVEPEAPPVLVFSGKGDIGDVVKTFKLGVLDFIPKPVENFELLGHAIENALERNSLRRAAALAERRYFNLVQNLPLLIFVLRRDLTLEFVNKFCSDMLGFGRVEIFGEPRWLLDRLHPEDRPRIEAALLGVLAGEGEAEAMECRFLHKSGGVAHAIMKCMPSMGAAPDELPEFIEGMVMDITERVELEKIALQDEKLKTLGVMSAELAHEIRNPLMSIAGFAKRLQNKQPELRETEIILSESERLEALLKRIADYLHPVEMRPAPCSLNDIAGRALEFLSPEIADRKIAPLIEFAEEPVRVMEDRDLLSQVVINLAGHAVRLQEEGGMVQIRTSAEGRYVHLEIRFDRSGPAADPERLFLPFEESGENRGLPISYRIVKNMGGSLTYEQRDGKAVFSMALPVKEA